MSTLARPLWADLHNHNAVGYGKGSLERSYSIARGALLDVYAFTPHGRWHDAPAEDARMAAYHARGYEIVQQSWPAVQRAANEANADGRFTALVAFEFHSSQFGDYHVLLPGDSGELIDPGSLAELQDYARRCGAVIVPHHMAYEPGWRGVRWDLIAPDVSPCVDVFSEHGCSMEPVTPHPFVLHSMGGIQRSQTAMGHLDSRRPLGLLGSTDNHHGHPASYGEGLAGIWATSHSRAGVLDAIRRRHTFVVSGDRITLDARLGDAMMGDVVDRDAPAELRYRVQGIGPIEFVQVIKNGRVAHAAFPDAEAARDDDTFCVQLDFGWDAMSGKCVTDWAIRMDVKGGQIVDVIPRFAGGAGSHERLNRVVTRTADAVEIEAFTSRANSHPIGGLTLRIRGDAGTTVRAEAQTHRDGEAGGCTLSASIGEMAEADRWGMISRVFSSPRMRLGGGWGRSQTSLEGAWVDPQPKAGDWYVLKAQQKNGQLAYASPIYRV